MIKTFKCKDTESLFNRTFVKRFSGIERQAVKSLDRLHASPDLDTLANLKGNRLKSLSGNRKGQFSMRVNDQWRLCFRWKEGAIDIKLVDYH